MSDSDEIIIGDEQVAIVQANIALVNPRMKDELEAIIAQYRANPATVTVLQRLFFANCQAQILLLLAQ
jgi:hypothetical protein